MADVTEVILAPGLTVKEAVLALAKVVPVVDAQRFHAHIAGRGYTARAGTASVSIAAADLPGGTWKRYAHGVSRATPFGHETITLAKKSPSTAGSHSSTGGKASMTKSDATSPCSRAATAV